MSKTYSDGTGGIIVCTICQEPVDIDDKDMVKQYPPFSYVHKKCEFGDALSDIAKTIDATQPNPHKEQQ